MKKKILILLLKLTVSTVLLYLVYNRISAIEFKEFTFYIPWYELLFLMPVLFINSILNTWKWKLILDATEIKLPFKALLSSHLIGTFLNIFMPSNIGGDAYRIYDISKQSARPVRSLTSVLADRISGFTVLTLCGLIASIVFFELHDDIAVIIPPMIVFIILLAGIFMLLQQSILFRIIGVLKLSRFEKINKLVESFMAAFKTYRENPLMLVKIMTISVCFYAISILFVYMLAVAIGFKIGFAYFCIYVPLIMLMEAIPASIYGIGFRDAGYVLFFVEVGLSSAQALQMSVTYVTISLLYSLLGGILLAVRMMANKSAPVATGGDRAVKE